VNEDKGKRWIIEMEFFKSITVKVILLFLLLIAGFMIKNGLEEKHEEQVAEEDSVFARRMEYAESVKEDNKILLAFLEFVPDADVQIACEEDVTNDGLKDLVVIYKKGDLTRTVVVIDSGDGENYEFTEPIPGPIENQKIQFKNIDKEDEIEFIIMGEKNGAVGYAIYRMIDGVPTDLFGEGMEDCC